MDRLDYLENFAITCLQATNMIDEFEVDKFINLIGGEYFDSFDEEHVVGYVIKTGDESFSILFNRNYNYNNFRYVFQLLHIVGFLFLEMGFLIDNEKWKKYKIGEKIEYSLFWNPDRRKEITFFVLSLMMPREKFTMIARKHVNENGKYVINDISDYFNLHWSYISKRGDYLELWYPQEI